MSEPAVSADGNLTVDRLALVIAALAAGGVVAATVPAGAPRVRVRPLRATS